MADSVVSPSVATPSVGQEQAFLESYFQCLSKFAYDKAKEITDKEREDSKTHATVLWSTLLNLLNSLSSSEKTFYSLLYLSNNFPWIKRKDTLRTTYSCLLMELKKIEKAHAAALPADEHTLELLIGHLCSQLQHFITARIKAIGFYEQIDTLGQNRNLTSEETEDLLGVVTEISSVCQTALKHPILSPLLSSFSLECDSITHLLQAQINIQSCQYLPALLELFAAHTKLNTWQSLLTARDTKKLGFVPTPKVWSPALHGWMNRYKNALVSKFTLYFYEVLCRQGSLPEVKALTAKTSLDFYAKISTFQKRSDVSNISLLFHAQQRTDEQESFAGLGYHLTPPANHPQSGHGGYYAILSCPSELGDSHWLPVYNVLVQKRQELDSATEKPVYLCDEGKHSSATYFLLRTDPLVTLLVVFETKKVERDSHVTQFMTNLASELRCTRQFATLRPGHK